LKQPNGVINLAEVGYPEKEDLKFGFIKLTDMAPLAIAYERGYFEDEGLYVTLEAQANWKVLLDGVIDRPARRRAHAGRPAAGRDHRLRHQGAHRHAAVDGPERQRHHRIQRGLGEDEAARAEDGRRPPQHPIKADYLKPVVEEFKAQGKPFKMGMVFPVSTHNYELRYWLAAGGIHPGYYAPHKGDIAGTIEADALLSVTPPPQMPATLEAGTIHGYCVGEPWNQQAVFKGIGVPVITDYEIWKNNPEKVFGMTKEFTEQYPNTTVRIVKAMMRAAKWLDAERQRQPSGGGAHPVATELRRRRLRGHRQLDDRHLRVREGRQARGARLQRLLPLPRDLSLLLGRGLVPDPDAPLGPDRRARCRTAGTTRWPLGLPARHLWQAAKALIAEGHMTADEFPDFASETGYRPPQSEFIDGVTFDGTQPNAYLTAFEPSGSRVTTSCEQGARQAHGPPGRQSS
jgi:nitrate/nitrite transport system substrate-binding protein